MTAPNMVGVSLKVPIWSSGVRTAGVMEKNSPTKLLKYVD